MSIGLHSIILFKGSTVYGVRLNAQNDRFLFVSVIRINRLVADKRSAVCHQFNTIILILYVETTFLLVVWIPCTS